MRHSEQIWQQQALTSALDLIRPKTFISSGDYHLYVGAFDKEKRELNDLYAGQRPTNAKVPSLGQRGDYHRTTRGTSTDQSQCLDDAVGFI